MVTVWPSPRSGIGVRGKKSEYVRLTPPIIDENSSTKWHERQLIDLPAKGDG